MDLETKNYGGFTGTGIVGDGYEQVGPAGVVGGGYQQTAGGSAAEA